MGARDVPSFYRVQQLQRSFEKDFKRVIRKEVSTLGNVYYMRDLPDIIAKVSELVAFRLAGFF